MTAGGDPALARVLLVPGGASIARGYYPHLGAALAGRARVLELDVPGIGPGNDGRALRFSDYADALAQAVRPHSDGPLVVVGHSLGGLVALRLALDEPYLVSGLLLLDPTPPNPTLLKGMGVFLRLSAPLGPIGQRLWERRARRDLRGVAMDADQARAFEVYTARGFLAETARWGRHLARDGATLAGDLTTGQAPSIPTIVVSAGYHRPKSSIRRAHEQLVARMRGAELQVWAGARHPLHIQHPTRVTNLVLSLLDRTQKVERASG